MAQCPDCHRKTLKLRFDSEHLWNSNLRCPVCAYNNTLIEHLRLLFRDWNISIHLHRDCIHVRFIQDRNPYTNISIDDNRLLTFAIDSELEAAVSYVYQNIQNLNGLTSKILLLTPTNLLCCPVCYSINFSRVLDAEKPTLKCCEHFQILDTAYVYSVFYSTSLPDEYALTGSFPIMTISIVSEDGDIPLCEIKPRWGKETTIILIQPLTENKKAIRRIVKHFEHILPENLFTVVKAL